MLMCMYVNVQFMGQQIFCQLIRMHMYVFKHPMTWFIIAFTFSIVLRYNTVHVVCVAAAP